VQRNKQKLKFLRRKRYVLFIYLLFGGVCSGLVTSCQTIGELRVAMSGASQPRNHREKTIFDYFYALRERRCKDAYELRANHLAVSGTYESSISACMERISRSMPSRISIGEERKVAGRGEVCGYRYMVYVSTSEGQLQRGEVSLAENPKKPGSCQVVYNSAFGDP
jgi:hypothetical protein